MKRIAIKALKITVLQHTTYNEFESQIYAYFKIAIVTFPLLSYMFLFFLSTLNQLILVELSRVEGEREREIIRRIKQTTEIHG